MSDDSNGASTPTDTSTPAPSTAPADPNWLPARLDRERRSILKDLGVEDINDAKTAIAELKKRQDAERSEIERLKSENAELNGKALRAKELESALKVRVESELSGLSEQQRETVLKLAGDDPTKQIYTLENLRSAGMLASTKPNPPPPATTAPAAPPPTPPSSATPANHVATYERLKKENPALAARYRLENYVSMQEELKAQT